MWFNVRAKVRMQSSEGCEGRKALTFCLHGDRQGRKAFACESTWLVWGVVGWWTKHMREKVQDRTGW